MSRDRPLTASVILEVEPALISSHDAMKMDALHAIQQAKKLATFRNSHLLQIVSQFVLDITEMDISRPK
jgi:hypothetical protein